MRSSGEVASEERFQIKQEIEGVPVQTLGKRYLFVIQLDLQGSRGNGWERGSNIRSLHQRGGSTKIIKIKNSLQGNKH